jgi:hypothetical protein
MIIIVLFFIAVSFYAAIIFSIILIVIANLFCRVILSIAILGGCVDIT